MASAAPGQIGCNSLSFSWMDGPCFSGPVLLPRPYRPRPVSSRAGLPCCPGARAIGQAEGGPFSYLHRYLPVIAFLAPQDWFVQPAAPYERLPASPLETARSAYPLTISPRPLLGHGATSVIASQAGQSALGWWWVCAALRYSAQAGYLEIRSSFRQCSSNTEGADHARAWPGHMPSGQLNSGQEKVSLSSAEPCTPVRPNVSLSHAESRQHGASVRAAAPASL